MSHSLLCQELLEFSERATSHDVPTERGVVRFARACELVAPSNCDDCGYPVCTHHRWSKHATHAFPEADV